jgi:hypothetical protein
MAGISNLTIAVEVLVRLPQGPHSLQDVESRLKDYLSVLTQLQHNPRVQLPSDKLIDLAKFFFELQEQGNLARHTAFARRESPVQ